jgi:hypothetical protein
MLVELRKGDVGDRCRTGRTPRILRCRVVVPCCRDLKAVVRGPFDGVRIAKQLNAGRPGWRQRQQTVACTVPAALIARTTRIDLRGKGADAEAVGDSC